MRIGIGQDSHRFEDTPQKTLMLGGVAVPDHPGLRANSDGDVVLHALANAISGVTGVNVLGETADRMCREGVTDSAAYVREALRSLEGRIANVSVSLECRTPKITPLIPAMRERIAALLGIAPGRVGITATSGEGLTAFGRGEGIQAFCAVLAEE